MNLNWKFDSVKTCLNCVHKNISFDVEPCYSCLISNQKEGRRGCVMKDLEERRELYKNAIEKWKELQITMVFEEFGELMILLARHKRGRWNSNWEIAGEIADCEIMLEQMREYFNIWNETDERKEKKLERLKGRLEKT